VLGADQHVQLLTLDQRVRHAAGEIDWRASLLKMLQTA
jgi:hypothetical protein